MPDSSPDISLSSFVRTTQKSGLIDSARIQQVLDQLPADISGDAAAVARQLVEQNLITDWQASKLLRGKHKGFSLGKYRLLRLLGKGGMSSVYLAEHTLMRRRCALKVLPIGRVDNTSWLARFHREAQAIAALDHPNIVRAYDIDHEEDGERNIHFLVMEFVDGRSIQEIIADDGPLSLEKAVDYFRQAALGLEHAHQAGLVHRDVKPGNLLVDQNGVVKVLDLGLARFAEVAEETPLTVTHDERVLGTADYLSPEQAIDSHTVDSRADVYSLGCSVYFALTGRPPFKDGSLAQRLMAHQMKEAPPIAEFRPEIDETEKGRALAAIVRRMMARDPDQRFQSMADVATTLEDWLQQSDKSTSSVSPAAPVVAPPVAVPVAQPVTSLPVAGQPPVAQPVQPAAGSEAVPVAVPVAAPVATAVSLAGDVPVAKPAAPVAPTPAAAPVALPVSAALVSEPPTSQTDVTPPPEAPSVQSVDEALPVVDAPAAGGSDFFDPDFIPQPSDGPGDLPGIPTGFGTPLQFNAVQDVSQTEPLAPQQTGASETPPDFAGFGGEPTFQAEGVAASEQLPADQPPAEASSEEFLELLPDDEALDEPDQTIETAAGGSRFPSVAPSEPSSAPVFPPAEPGFASESAPFTPAPVSAPAEFTPQPAASAPGFPSFEPPGTDAAGLASAAAPSFEQPSFGQPPMGQPPASQFPAAAPLQAQPPAAAVQQPGRRKPSSPMPLIVGALVLLIVGGGAAWFLMSGKDTKSPGKRSTASSGKSTSGKSTAKSGSSKSARSVTPASSGTVKATLSVGPGHEYKTIAAALAYVRANKSRYPDTTRKTVVRIEVAGSETFNEVIEIDNSNKSYPAGIQIKSTNEFPVTLKPSGRGPAIRLVSIENLQLDNFHVDASGMDVAVELEGFLNRSTLSNFKISGFRKTGILGKGIAGVQRDEVVFDHVDLRSADASAVGIKLTSGKASTGRINIHDCRVFGPQSAGILLDNGAIGVDIRRTIIDQADMGVSFASGPLEWRDVRLVNNTFHQIGQAAIHFSDMPVTGSSGMEFRRNLFAGMKGPELKVGASYDDKAFDAFVSTDFGSIDLNWTDRSQPANPANGERDLIAREERHVPGFQFFSTDRNADDFLTPQRGTPYSSVGVRAGDDGDPFIGARPRPE